MKLFNALGDARDILGHLGTSAVLNEVDGLCSTRNWIKAPSDPFSRSFVKRKHISPRLHRCVDDMLRILLKLVFLFSNEFCVLLFKLIFFSSELLAPGTSLCLYLKDGVKHQGCLARTITQTTIVTFNNNNYCGLNITICVALKACSFLISSLIC